MSANDVEALRLIFLKPLRYSFYLRVDLLTPITQGQGDSLKAGDAPSHALMWWLSFRVVQQKQLIYQKKHMRANCPMSVPRLKQSKAKLNSSAPAPFIFR